MAFKGEIRAAMIIVAAIMLMTPLFNPCRTTRMIIGIGHSRVAMVPSIGMYTAMRPMITVMAAKRPPSVVDFILNSATTKLLYSFNLMLNYIIILIY